MSKKTTVSTGTGLIGLAIVTYGFIQFVAGGTTQGVIAFVAGFSLFIFGVSKKTSSTPENEPEDDFTYTAATAISRDNRRVVFDDDEYLIDRRDEKPLKCTFHRQGEFINIQGHSIEGPVYTGKRNRHQYGEPAILDPKLKVSSSKVVDPLGYWPDYGDLSPAQRGDYLAWLSTGRGPSEELGYVFLYFYGLERYIYRDAEKDNEKLRDETLQFIISDVERLLSLFSDSRSFESYANNLLDAIHVKFWTHQLSKRKETFPARHPIAASHVIIEQANNSEDKQLDSDWALQWLLGFGGVSRTKAVRDNYSVFRALFRYAYEKKTKGGLKIPTCKRKAGTLHFSPSSQGLDNVATHDYPSEWYSPLELKRPLGKLEEIFREIAPGARKLSKAMASKEPLESLSAWPTGVPISYSHELMAIVEKLQPTIEAEPNITLSRLVHLFEHPTTDKFTTTQMRKIASALETCGYAVVPDPNCTPVSLKSSDSIITYKGSRLSALSPEGEHVATAVQLGAMLALADGDVHEHEVAILTKLVNSHPNSAERSYLHHYAAWRLSQPASTAGLKKGIDRLDVTQKRELSEMLISLARADGQLPKDEVRELEKLFKRLGLEGARVSEMLHDAAVASPVANQAKIKTQDSTSKAGVGIDYDTLKAHAASTQEVQSVLSQIFEEDADNDENPAALVTQNLGAWHGGRLDGPHDILATWLLTAEEWPMESVTEKCNELKLMPEGALTAINEAAFDTLGDSLLEVGSTVEVYRDVLDE